MRTSLRQIDGRMVPLDSKHTVLNAEFKDRP